MSRMSKRMLLAVACVAATTAMVPRSAVAWNAGTHAYIAAEIQKKAGRVVDPQLLVNRRYGANGPDLFNYGFGQPWLTIADYLHEYITSDATLRLWDAALQTGDAALIEYAYGFVSHDNAFGADRTAHIEAVTGGVKEGYVIAKAALLAERLQAVFAQMQIEMPAAQVQLGAHVLVESAVDLLVQERLDPGIGVELLEAVDGADPRIADLLAAAYGEPLAQYFPGGEPQAEAAIGGMESYFRNIERQYAQALATSSVDAFGPLASFNSALAEKLFGMPAASLHPIVMYGIGQAIALVEPDFQREIFATIGWVNGNLSSRGVSP